MIQWLGVVALFLCLLLLSFGSRSGKRL